MRPRRKVNGLFMSWDQTAPAVVHLAGDTMTNVLYGFAWPATMLPYRDGNPVSTRDFNPLQNWHIYELQDTAPVNMVVGYRLGVLRDQVIYWIGNFAGLVMYQTSWRANPCGSRRAPTFDSSQPGSVSYHLRDRGPVFGTQNFLTGSHGRSYPCCKIMFSIDSTAGPRRLAPRGPRMLLTSRTCCFNEKIDPLEGRFEPTKHDVLATNVDGKEGWS